MPSAASAARRLRASSLPTSERSELGLAGSTGLEPAASGVTGRRSNQLNYDPKLDVRDGRMGRVLPVWLYQACPADDSNRLPAPIETA